MYFSKFTHEQNAKNVVNILELRLVIYRNFRISFNKAFKRNSERIYLVLKKILRWGEKKWFLKSKEDNFQILTISGSLFKEWLIKLNFQTLTYNYFHDPYTAKSTGSPRIPSKWSKIFLAITVAGKRMASKDIDNPDKDTNINMDSKKIANL